MSFLDTVTTAKNYLRENGRVSIRGLKREFELAEDALEELIEELVDVQEVAAREGKIISWVGAAATGMPAGAAVEVAPRPDVVTAAAAPALSESASAEGERRQLTVMFCDLVGSTQLSGRIDAEDLREAVHAYQAYCAEIIQHLGGEIAQYLGDGLLVYFGYPRAHDDDALRAVRAGLRIIEGLSGMNGRLAERLPALREHPLRVRISVHTGQVVVGSMGASGRQEQLALGDTVNIAARLQEAAEPDSIVIADATRRLVRGAFVIEEIGPRELKGIGEPVTVYHVLRASGVVSGLGDTASLTPLVGREQEVALLLDRWRDATEGHGQVLLLSGEAGMGKSRLVQVLRERIADDAHTWIETRGSPYHQNSAFHPVIELLHQALLFTLDETPEEQVTRIRRGLDQAGLSIAEVLPLITNLLGLPAPTDLPALQLSPEAQRRRTLESLCAWILALAEVQPLILVAEDLHWSDPSTLDFLGMLLEQAPTAPVFLLATFRPTFESQWPHRSHVAQLPLHPLTRRQIEVLVGRVAGEKPLPAEVVEQIVAKTDRVPLFVEELTKTILESDLLISTEDAYELAGPLPDLAIPSTLQDSLMARLDRLGPAKEVAQLCAAMGREFSHELLEAVASMDAPFLSQMLAGLASAELLYQRGVAPNAIYHFKHALLQEMAYQSLLKKTRRDYHARITNALEERFPERVETEPEVVARHCEAGGLGEKAIHYYERAALRASERSANAEAIGHLTKAIGLVETLPEGPERGQRELALQVALGRPLAATKGWGSAEVEAAYGRARLLCQELGESPQMGPALSGLAAFYVTRSQLDDADQVSRQLLRVGEQQQDLDGLAYGHYTQGLVHYLLGRPVQALSDFDHAISLHEKSGDHVAYMSGNTGVSARIWGAWALWVSGYPDRCIARSCDAIDMARRIEDPFSLAYSLTWAAVAHHMRGEREPALELVEQAIPIAAEQDFAIPLGVSQMIGIWASLASDSPDAEVDEALAETQRILGGLGATGTQAAVPQILGVLAGISLDTNRVEDAATYIESALAAAADTGQRYWDAELHRLKGQVASRRDAGADAEAEEHLQRALEIARRQEARSLELRAAADLAALWRQQGKREEARAHLARVYDGFTEGLDTQDLKNAKTLLDELS